MNEIIIAMLSYLIDNAEELSKDNYSGVHYTDDWECYRVHVIHFLPTFLNSPRISNVVNDKISKVIDTWFHGKCEYDSKNNWLTIF